MPHCIICNIYYIILYNTEGGERVLEYNMTDEKLKEILLEQMYALNKVETNDKFIELRKVEWQNTIETYQAKRIQKLYFYWKNRR